jgi:hypothetical protein
LIREWELPAVANVAWGSAAIRCQKRCRPICTFNMRKHMNIENMKPITATTKKLNYAAFARPGMDA